ncbi:MAG: DUF1963 domain-containing protein, partial [Pseudomonadota bacterium]
MNIFKWLFGAADDRGAEQSDTERHGRLEKAHSERKVVSNDLPPELLKWHERLEATRRPILAATLLDGLPETRSGSQLGGMAWWPTDRPYPVDESNIPLQLLLQVNFDDAPVLEGFPETGLLQLFVGTGEHYGCDFDNPERSPGFVCIYHDDTIGSAITEIPDDAVSGRVSGPLENPQMATPLSFAHDTMLIDPTTHQFMREFADLRNDARAMELYELVVRNTPKIRLGGYATFAQTDPRAHDAALGDVTLACLETIGPLMWGDAGVAQFLIDADDLKRRNVSQVAYNWDCA